MISVKVYGKLAEVKINNFTVQASYGTNLPVEILQAFVHSYEDDIPASVYFNTEEMEYIFTSYGPFTYLIEKGERSTLRSFNSDRDVLATELLADVEEHLEEWADWMPYATVHDTQKAVLLYLTAALRHAMAEYKRTFEKFKLQAIARKQAEEEEERKNRHF